MDDRIREAVEADIPRILEMGARSLREGPYRDQLGDNLEPAEQLCVNILQSESGRVLLYEKDGHAVGLLAFIVVPHFFTGELTGNEIIWYVEPEHRKSLTVLAMPRAAERIAREMGAKRMQFTAPTAQVGRMYELLGYHQLEVAYQKDLTPCPP